MVRRPTDGGVQPTTRNSTRSPRSPSGLEIAPEAALLPPNGTTNSALTISSGGAVGRGVGVAVTERVGVPVGVFVALTALPVVGVGVGVFAAVGVGVAVEPGLGVDVAVPLGFTVEAGEAFVPLPPGVSPA